MSQEIAFRRVDVAFARELLSKGETLVLDVRDEASYAKGHIDGARRAGRDNLHEFLTGAPKDMPVLVYCRKGNSSQDFAKTFADLGFTQALSLDGGYDAWVEAHRDPAHAAAPAALSDALRAFLVAENFSPEDVNGVGANALTPLMTAAYKGPPDIVAELLRAGARVDACNGDGGQPLWLACVGDDPAIVAMLIAAGADLDHRNVNGSTALMYAASAGKAKALKALLEAGADLACEVDGVSALDMASTLECLNLMRAEQKRRPKS
ncbi:ankyrin repeat domain-containing protein [Methylocapsa acidiphila]|uniref:ankyrin repeat domain-containing protein n=1 Tax=Methylocapsa acidiphila TaxID=133552 RepID=UPI00047EA5EB|nr:ankyrin repeat domain-containing protein [Methylocapsa acidiphila]